MIFFCQLTLPTIRFVQLHRHVDGTRLWSDAAVLFWSQPRLKRDTENRHRHLLSDSPSNGKAMSVRTVRKMGLRRQGRNEKKNKRINAQSTKLELDDHSQSCHRIASDRIRTLKRGPLNLENGVARRVGLVPKRPARPEKNQRVKECDRPPLPPKRFFFRTANRLDPLFALGGT